MNCTEFCFVSMYALALVYIMLSGKSLEVQPL